MKEQESWLVGCLSKRTPAAIRILSDLIEAGLRNGKVSANDIKDVHFDQPNVIGCTMRLLPKFGFEHTDERVKMTAKRKHKRRADVWILANRLRAEQFIAHQRRLLVQVDHNGNEMFNF